MILARKLYAYGAQVDYVKEANCIGFVRHGDEEHPAGLACVMSNTKKKHIKMAVGKGHKGEVWTDVMGWRRGEVTIDEKGYGDFPCSAKSVSVWVRGDAVGRERFGKL